MQITDCLLYTSDSECIQDRVAVLIVERRTLFCLINGCNIGLRPCKSNFLNIVHILMAVLHAVLNEDVYKRRHLSRVCFLEWKEEEEGLRQTMNSADMNLGRILIFIPEYYGLNVEERTSVWKDILINTPRKLLWSVKMMEKNFRWSRGIWKCFWTGLQ